MKWWIILLIVLAAAAAVTALFFFLRSCQLRRAGIWGMKKTGGILRRFAGIRSFRVIEGIKLPYGDKTVAVSQILIGFFGIIVLNVKEEKGEIYGDPSSAEWLQVTVKGKDENRSETKRYFKNPSKELQEQVDAVRRVLSAANIYRVNIEGYIVFAEKKTALSVGKGLPVLTLRELKKLLGKEKYSADGNLDVPQVYQTICDKAVL